MTLREHLEPGPTLRASSPASTGTIERNRDAGTEKRAHLAREPSTIFRKPSTGQRAIPENPSRDPQTETDLSKNETVDS